jgi:hypothetical protein
MKWFFLFQLISEWLKKFTKLNVAEFEITFLSKMFSLSRVDHALMVGCKHEIKTHCQEQSEPNGILNCLKVNFICIYIALFT